MRWHGRWAGLAAVLALISLALPDLASGAWGAASAPIEAKLTDLALYTLSLEQLAGSHFTAAESSARILVARIEHKKSRGRGELGEALDLFGEAIVRGSPRRAAEAVIVSTRAVAEKERAFGPDAPEVAVSLQVLAEALGASYRPDSVILATLSRASSIRERCFGPDDPSVATTQLRMGIFLGDRGDYGRGRAHLERALRIRESALGPGHPEVAEVLLPLAMGLAGSGQPIKARPLLERAVSICAGISAPGDPRLAKALVGLGYVEMMTGDGAAGRVRLERAIAIDSTGLAPDAVELAIARRTLAAILIVMGDGVGARRLAEQSVASLERTLGPEGPQLAISLGTLAAAIGVSGDRDGAIEQFARTIPMLEQYFGERNPRVASARLFLGQLLGQTGKTARGLSLTEQGLADLERALGPDNQYVISARAAFASALHSSGDYEHARAILAAVIPHAERTADPELARIYANFAVAELSVGEFSQARSHLERAIDIQKASRGSERIEEALQLANFGILLREMGDLNGSRTFQERALALRRQILGARHPLVAASLSNIGALLILGGDSAAARPYLTEAATLLEGTQAPELAAALENLALLAHAPDDLTSARVKMERARAILEATYGAEHPLVASWAQDLAVLLERAGEHAAAGRQLVRALEIREAALGPRHPLLASTRVCLARWALDSGDVAEALQQSLRAERIGRDHLQTTIRGLAERQALRFAEVRNSGLDLALTLVGSGRVGREGAAAAWDAVIGARALVLEEMALRHRSIFAGGDTITAALGDSLERVTARLANLSLHSPDADLRAYRERLDGAAADKGRFERSLGERSAAFRATQERRALGFSGVRAALPQRAALVAFAEYHRQIPGAWAASVDGAPSPTDGPDAELLAFVLVAGDSLPMVVSLGETQAIDRLVGAWRLHVGRESKDPLSGRYEERACAAAGDSLRRHVWDPLARWLDGLDQVFVVPVGSLNLVNFGALPAGSARFVIESLPLIHYLSSERDLVPWHARREAGAGMLAMGGVDFDVTDAAPPADVIAAGLRGADDGDAQASRRDAGSAPYRGSRSDCAEFAKRKFYPLRETVREVREVCDIWSRRPSSERPWREPRTATVLVARVASEGAFKLLAPGRRVIHLATHGFFLNERCRPSTDVAPSGLPGSARETVAITRENPLLLSGLVLAGANRRDRAGTEGEDGILTAEEVAALDLTGADWIVLSACETGLGVVEGGEGVFGLRRAFSVAGAQTVVMSLWRVEDQATRRWVRLLYEARFGRGLETAVAMRAASLEYLAECRARGASTHPAGWGAFIAAENYRPAPPADGVPPARGRVVP